MSGLCGGVSMTWEQLREPLPRYVGFVYKTIILIKDKIISKFQIITPSGHMTTGNG